MVFVPFLKWRSNILRGNNSALSRKSTQQCFIHRSAPSWEGCRTSISRASCFYSLHPCAHMLPSWESSVSRPNQGHILFWPLLLKPLNCFIFLPPREIGRFILWQRQIILMVAERLQAGQVSGAPAPSFSSSSVLWYPPTHPYHVFCLDQLPRYIFQSSPGPTAIPFLAICASSWYFL